MNDVQEKMRKIFQEHYCVEVELLQGGLIPLKAHSNDAGFDLYATSDIVVKPGEIIKHPLNLRMQLPRGTYAEITSKSGLGCKGLLVYSGIIDGGYRGVCHVVATNLSKEDIVIQQHHKIAQMILHPFNTNYYMIEVDEVDTSSERGEGGFGSTGE